MAAMHGEKSYLALASEDIWGTNPSDASGTASGSQGFVHLPVFNYGVTQRDDRRLAQPFIGLRQRKHATKFRGMPSGQIVTSLYGALASGTGISVAEYVSDWALESPETLLLPSKTAHWAEGPDTSNVEHLGLRVNQATVEGSDETGFCQLTIDVMGKTEQAGGTSPALPADRNKLQEFEFSDCTFSIDDGAGGALAAQAIKSFQWQVNNNLQVEYLNSYTPTHLVAGQRVETLQVEFPKENDTYAAFRRATTDTEFVARLTLKGRHNGTLADTFVTMQIDFYRLSLAPYEDQRDVNELLRQTLQFDVLKPDTSNNGTAITWGTSA